MAAEYEEGWVAHEAAWHKNAEIKGERPKTWDDAREGFLGWEPVAEPIYRLVPDGSGGVDPERIDEFVSVRRSDTDALLTVQPDSYAIIGNGEFGGIIDYAMGVDIPGMPKLAFDTLSVLKGGRIVAVSLYLEEPIVIPGDNSATMRYMHFWTRHDGLGGLKCGAGLFRIVCANTQLAAETAMDQHGFAFTIRHTKNWATKLEQARKAIVGATGQLKAWEEMATGMAQVAVGEAEVNWFLDNWLPFSTDMTDRMRDGVTAKRAAFLSAYDSQTCESIKGTVYGLSQAAVEACDHYFPANSMETRASRILLGGDNHKVRALYLAKEMAK